MSESDRRSTVTTETLDDDDRVWLAARLAEYQELLAYLRDH